MGLVSFRHWSVDGSPIFSQRTSSRDFSQDTNAGYGGYYGKHQLGDVVRPPLFRGWVSGERYEGTVRTILFVSAHRSSVRVRRSILPVTPGIGLSWTDRTKAGDRCAACLMSFGSVSAVPISRRILLGGCSASWYSVMLMFGWGVRTMMAYVDYTLWAYGEHVYLQEYGCKKGSELFSTPSFLGLDSLQDLDSDDGRSCRTTKAPYCRVHDGLYSRRS